MTQSEQIVSLIRDTTDPAELALLDAALGTDVEARNRPLVLSLLVLLAAAADLAAPIMDNAADTGRPLPEHVRELVRAELARIDVPLTAASKPSPILVSSL